jgi:glycosyltransferase involved in cell wall biosynthesis
MEKIIRLSVALATLNEDQNLERCIRSVKDIADEIIIVDGGSTDNTIEIANKYFVKIIKTDNPQIFHINKQKALDAANGIWILQLDADEEVTPELSQEIKSVINMTDNELAKRTIPEEKYKLFYKHQNLLEKRDGKIEGSGDTISAFFIPRLNFFLGGPIKHAGTYPDGVIRLVKNHLARFPQKSVHEQIYVDGKISWLNHDLWHHSNPTLKKYFISAGRYTYLEATRLAKLNNNFIELLFKYILYFPIHSFITLYFRHKGILDGWRGFLFCLLSAIHYPIIFYKLIRLKSKI